MSVVSQFTNTTSLTAGQNYVSPVADLKTFNALTSQVYLQWVGGSEVTLIVFLFSSDSINFDTRDEFTIENGIGQNISMPIHARYCKYEVNHLGPTDMTTTRITAAVHEESHENIDVNVNLSDSLTATITNEFNLEATQQQVKGLLDDVKLNTARVKTTDNVSDAIPVRLVAGIGGEFYNPLRAIGNDLSVYIDEMNPDVAVNSGLSTKALQEEMSNKLDTLITESTTQVSYLTSIDSKITEVNTNDVSITNSVLPTGASTSALQTTGNDYLNSVVLQTTETNNKLATANATLDNIKLDTANLVRVAPSDNNVQQAIPVRLMVGTSGAAFNALRSVNGDLATYVDDMNPDAVINSGMAKAPLQTDGNSKLDDIKSNTDNLVRVTPTTNVTEAIPVRLMVGTSGSAFNALRSVGGDLGVYVDDMNADAVNNSGMAKASLQTDGNNTLTTISTTLTTMDGVLDNIETGINKAVTTAVLYNNATVTSGTTTTTINMGTGKDRYNTIQVIGSSVTNGFDFRFDFSIDGTNWYSDGVFSTHYNNGATYEFVVSRLNVSVPYIRIHVGSTTGNNVYMSYALSKE